MNAILDMLTRPGDSPATTSLLALHAPLGPGRVSNDLDSERGIALRKGLRFDIFRRDNFTCRYCGAQPPDVVLEVDHVVPRVDGGTDEPINLVTSCFDCNRGKSRKRLDATASAQPDADIEYLAVQQEIAEIARYERSLGAREEARKRTVYALQKLWIDLTDLDWHPADKVLNGMLARYDAEVIEEAIRDVAPKVATGYIGERKWPQYMWAVARNIAAED